MLLLKKIQSFGASAEEMVDIWKTYCRSILEQSAVVWGPSITEENKIDLERTQKSFAKLILKNKYIHYEDSLIKLNLETLQERRQQLILNFATDCIKNKKFRDLFPLNEKDNRMNTRHQEKFQVHFANTNRMKNSSIVEMQNQLNKNEIIVSG